MHRRNTLFALLLLWGHCAFSQVTTPTLAADEARAQEAWQRALALEEESTATSWRQALEEYSKVLSYRQAGGDQRAAAEARFRIARVHDFLGEYDQSRELYEQLLPVFRATGNRVDEGRALNNLGTGYQQTAAPDRAIEHLTAALDIFRDLGDEPRHAVVSLNLAWYHHSLGEFREAAELYAQVLPRLRAAGRIEDQARLFSNLGMLNHDLGDLERARQHFETSLQLRRTIKSRRDESQTLSNLAGIYLDLGERPKAADLFQQALALAREMQEKGNQAGALLWMAYAQQDQGADEVGQAATEALNLSRQAGDGRREAIALRRLGEWHAAHGEAAMAEQNLNAALALHRRTGFTLGEADTLLALARLWSAQGDLDQSRLRARQAIDTMESLRAKLAQPHLRASFASPVQEYYELYIDVLMRLHERDPAAAHDVEALQVSERARSKGLLDALAEHQAEIRTGVDPQLLAREQEIRRTLNAKDQRLQALLADSHDDAAISAARRELDDALGKMHDVQGEIRARSPRYAALIQPDTISLTALQQHLDTNTVLLEYWLSGERSFLWAVTKSSVSSHVLPPAAAIERDTREYFAALTARPNPRRSAFDRAKTQSAIARIAKTLSNTLLRPVADQLGNKRVVIASHGVLQYLPFAALPVPGAAANEPTRLVENHELVNLPSASVLPVLRARPLQKRLDKVVAVLADPVFSADDVRLSQQHRLSAISPTVDQDDDLQRSMTESGVKRLRRLRFSRVEANAIASLVEDSQRFAAIDFKASRSAALSPELGHYRILHFATHGLINSVHPELSGLVFSAVDEQGQPLDAMMRLHEIFNLSLQSELVVLSACQTALGQEIKSEGLIGLARGFMHAGSPRVIASLWNVDDRATAELMKHFYRGLLDRNLTPASALRQAQLALLHDARWSHPYYWAGFVLQGDWN